MAENSLLKQGSDTGAVDTNASAPTPSPGTAHPLLLHCDLCVLAYQLYHQSVLWPLDPWYEYLANVGSDRRTHFMKLVHAWLKSSSSGLGPWVSGPAALRGMGDSNEALDPILTNYDQIAPKSTSWLRDGSKFIVVRAPEYLVGGIGNVDICTYPGRPERGFVKGSTRITEIQRTHGADHLIAFEGGTGSKRGSGFAWSLMGYVLKRTRGDGGYDAHIVFRGSRSGDAVRAATQGKLKAAGNPDWVTDTSTDLELCEMVSKTGKVALGFSEALDACRTPIFGALLELERLYGAPAAITVTGHSLGAALAAQFCSMLTLGWGGDAFRQGLPKWPWDTLRGFFYAEPPVGDKAFVEAFNARLACQAPFVLGDAVVECSSSVADAQATMGKVMSLFARGSHQVGTLLPYERPVAADAKLDDSHELYLIRCAVAEKLLRIQSPQSNVLSGSNVTALFKADVHSLNVSPWLTYRTFSDMLNGKPSSYTSMGAANPSMLTVETLYESLELYRFSKNIDEFISQYVNIITKPESYFASMKSSRELYEERFILANELVLNNDAKDLAGIADVTATAVAALIGVQRIRNDYMQGKKVTQFLGLAFILRTLHHYPSEKTQGLLKAFALTRELDDCLTAS